VNAAKGPNSRYSSPSTTRRSRCGTEMVGAPGSGWPYTLAGWAATRSGRRVRRNRPLIGKTASRRASGTRAACSSGRVPPPAPRKTNGARRRSRERSRLLRTSTCQRPSRRRSAVTSDRSRTSTPRERSAANSCRVRAPKSTSVPCVERVTATGSSPTRSPNISGSQEARTAGSSENSRSAKSGCSRSDSHRARRWATPSMPRPSPRCGTGRMKSSAGPIRPSSTRRAQNRSETRNRSPMSTAGETSTEPSGRRGV
jgi:hypothetical protein